MPGLACIRPITLEPAIPAIAVRSADGRVSATIVPSLGGVLSSLHLAGYGELLYRANDFSDPGKGEWSGRAPLLWPAVGRNYPAPGATELGWRCDERTLPMPIHGFARSLPWKVLGMGADRESAQIALRLADRRETQLCYPWPFTLNMRYTLDSMGLTQSVSIESPQAVRFGIGSHLSLRLLDPARWDEVVLASSASQRLEVSAAGLLESEPQPLEMRRGIPLSEEWLSNAVLTEAGSDGWLEVRYPDGPTVRVTQKINEPRKLVRREDRLFVLYGRRDRGFICPEPWVGRPNGLQTGLGAIDLPPGAPLIWTMRIDLEGL